ncbi:prepilin peptidase [Methanocaldococcus sp.]
MINYIFGLICLLIASIQDIKKREVENYIWIAMILFGFIYFLILTIKYSDIYYIKIFFISLIISFILGYLMFLFGAGGADGKAIIGVSALVPNYPLQLKSSIFQLFFSLNLPIFPILVFINSIFLITLYPLIIFIKNILINNVRPKNLKEFFTMFLAEKIKMSKVKKEKRIILGKDKIEFIRHGEEALNYEGYEESDIVWASPAIPFILIIFLSYLITPIVGDSIIYYLLKILGLR